MVELSDKRGDPCGPPLHSQSPAGRRSIHRARSNGQREFTRAIAETLTIKPIFVHQGEHGVGHRRAVGRLEVQAALEAKLAEFNQDAIKELTTRFPNSDLAKKSKSTKK